VEVYKDVTESTRVNKTGQSRSRVPSGEVTRKYTRWNRKDRERGGSDENRDGKGIESRDKHSNTAVSEEKD